MLFEDLRIDPDKFHKLDHNAILVLSEQYHSTNVRK